jgi:L-aminopeptidase/D-esterase-like protein
MIRPGPRNLITDVDGISVGNAARADARTGVTVVLPDEACIAAVDVRGGAPGTRETELLNPVSLVDRVDAISLSGGSAFGLGAAEGVATWLAAQGRGFEAAGFKIPIVPAAILFDLANGGEKSWGNESPYTVLGTEACREAKDAFDLGNVGAGFGATAGPLKGGLGSASAVHVDGLQIGAIVAVNSSGPVTMPGRPQFWSWALEQNEEFGGLDAPGHVMGLDFDYQSDAVIGANTTLAVVATNASLTSAQATRVAIMAQDGLSRAIRPVHTPFDGDTVFVLSTAKNPLADPTPAAISRIGAIAADCVSRAVARGVYLAESMGDMRSYREVYAGKV